MDKKPLLNCEQCARRKTKCDKSNPCSACVAAGLSCISVQRARRPRGRAAKVHDKAARLEDRVARMEDLLKHVQSPTLPGCNPNAFGRTNQVPPMDISAPSRGGAEGQAGAGDFWLALSEEVAGLRDVLECSDDEDYFPNHATAEVLGSDFNTSTLLLFQGSPNYVQSAYSPLSQATKASLLDIYHDRVDFIFKVLHWPSALVEIQQNERSTYTSAHPASLALEYAIYYMAVSSLNEDEAQQQLLCDKAYLLDAFQRTTELHLQGSNMLREPSLLALQAFAIYIFAVQVSASRAAAWSLVALLIRLASAIKLGSEESPTCSPLEVQLRRRLWYSIGILDTQTALDRGFVPLLTAKHFQLPPLYVNDCDISPIQVPVTSSQGFTDMSFSQLVHDATLVHLRICDMTAVHGWNHWEERLQVVSNFEQSLNRKFQSTGDGTDPRESLTKFAAQSIVANLQLVLRRPPYKLKISGEPPWDGFDVVQAATNILEGHLRFEARGLASWKWKAWDRWYALAVVLAELCGRPSGAISDRAFAVAQEYYELNAHLAVDLDSSVAWKPIGKLMRQVEKFRTPSVPCRSASQVNPQLIHPDSNNQHHTELFRHRQLKSSDTPMFSDLCTKSTTGAPTANGDSHVFPDQSVTDPYSEVELPWVHWDLFLEDLTSPSQTI